MKSDTVCVSLKLKLADHRRLGFRTELEPATSSPGSTWRIPAAKGEGDKVGIAMHSSILTMSRPTRSYLTNQPKNQTRSQVLTHLTRGKTKPYLRCSGDARVRTHPHTQRRALHRHTHNPPPHTLTHTIAGSTSHRNPVFSGSTRVHMREVRG